MHAALAYDFCLRMHKWKLLTLPESELVLSHTYGGVLTALQHHHHFCTLALCFSNLTLQNDEGGAVGKRPLTFTVKP